jgi:hypothetical protein
MLSFFNSGYISMDVLQDVEGERYNTLKFNKHQDQEKSLGIDVQTKHIYNLIEMGKKGQKNNLNS